MTFPTAKFTDRLKDRDAALKRQAEVLQRRQTAKPAEPASTVAPPVAAPPAAPTPRRPPRVAAVRMNGEPTLKITVDGQPERQYLAPALHECVDLYLQAAQAGSRHCALLWPGTLESLPLIHALATIERWVQGYKRGLRAALYPATSATFNRLNHIYADRSDISAFNSMWQELTEPRQEVPKESCGEKDLMLFALASQYRDDRIQPCLNELLPHFLLETGAKQELAGLNYSDTYLSHIITKLSKHRQKKDLREGPFQKLGPAATAPDAIFGLSFRMNTKALTEALTTLKAHGGFDVMLLDATRIAFDRVEKLQTRLATFLRCMTEVFGDGGPGVLIVTNDPRQMSYLRSAIQNEEGKRGLRFRVGRTVGLRLPESGRGLLGAPEVAVTLEPATISVELTDKPTARLANQAYRLSQMLHLTPPVVEAIGRASKFVQMMGNLPSSANLLYKRLAETMADDAERRRYDWKGLDNALTKALDTVPPNIAAPFFKWKNEATKLLALQESGTPLAKTMVTLAKRYATAGEKVLVIVQSGPYQQLAQEFFLNEADTEEMAERVAFASLASRKLKQQMFAPDRNIICAMAPDLLREIITAPTLPCAIDFLLTQHTATATYHALAPVLQFEEFKPYEARVRAIHDHLKAAQALSSGGTLPEFDYQTPVFSFTPPSDAAPSGGERGNTDYVEIITENGQHLLRGFQSRVYVYDPAAADSRSLGFRPISANDVREGQIIFVMSDEMREQAEAAFDAAGVIFDRAGAFEAALRQYQRRVRAAVAARFPGTVADAARAIAEAMQQRQCPQEVGNIRYWINLKNTENLPFHEVLPQAPRHFETFKVFTEVLGFDANDTTTFWEGAVKRVRNGRIADGISVGDHYANVLFDAEASDTYDRLPTDVLRSLRSGALDSVYEVAAVTLRTVTPKAS